MKQNKELDNVATETEKFQMLLEVARTFGLGPVEFKKFHNLSDGEFSSILRLAPKEGGFRFTGYRRNEIPLENMSPRIWESNKWAEIYTGLETVVSLSSPLNTASYPSAIRYELKKQKKKKKEAAEESLNTDFKKGGEFKVQDYVEEQNPRLPAKRFKKKTVEATLAARECSKTVKAIWNSKSKEYDSVRSALMFLIIFQKTGCIICGATDKLDLHMIDSPGAGGADTFKEKIYENVIMLCVACHKVCHSDDIDFETKQALKVKWREHAKSYVDNYRRLKASKRKS